MQHRRSMTSFLTKPSHKTHPRPLGNIIACCRAWTAITGALPGRCDTEEPWIPHAVQGSLQATVRVDLEKKDGRHWQ